MNLGFLALLGSVLGAESTEPFAPIEEPKPYKFRNFAIPENKELPKRHFRFPRGQRRGYGKSSRPAKLNALRKRKAAGFHK